MIELFKSVGDYASMGIIVDFSSKTEVYFIGNGIAISSVILSRTVTGLCV